ncbi:MAG: iron-sulfur cluster repair di-iron protein [Bacillota bacterium]
MNKTLPLGDIVATYPKAATIFENNNIDYCCHGYHTLEQAIKDHPNADTIMTQLKVLKNNNHSDNQDWTKAPISDLISHILQTHHAYLYKTLPILSDLSTKIYRVHGQTHEELKDVHRLFHTLKLELDEHLIKEETIQYPAIESYLATHDTDALIKAKTIIENLESEHEIAGDALKSLREITKDYTIPNDACEAYEKTYTLLRELEKDMFTHIHLENNVLFKRILAL